MKEFLKVHVVSDKNEKSRTIKKKVSKILNIYSPKKSNIILVIGGDGFMLSTLKKLSKFNKPFYGMNTGTYGFLMNKLKIINIESFLLKANPIKISPLEMIAVTKNNIKKKTIAINEVSMFRQSKQTASLCIKKGNSVITKKLISDGVIVSTPAGSTAYNLSVHGPILSLNSNKLAITPISPFRPRRWKGLVVNDKSTIWIENLSISKRPVSVVADNFEVRNVKKVKIFMNKKIKFTLLYDNKNSLNKKIQLEQLRKDT